MNKIILCILCLSLALLFFGKIAKYVAQKRKEFYEMQLRELEKTDGILNEEWREAVAFTFKHKTDAIIVTNRIED